MPDPYRTRHIDLNKLANHVRRKGFLAEEAALHLLDTIRVLTDERDELACDVCGDCNQTGWQYNRVEGRHACTCMTEMEPYQLLQNQLDDLTAERDALVRDLEAIRG